MFIQLVFALCSPSVASHVVMDALDWTATMGDVDLLVERSRAWRNYFPFESPRQALDLFHLVAGDIVWPRFMDHHRALRPEELFAPRENALVTTI